MTAKTMTMQEANAIAQRRIAELEQALTHVNALCPKPDDMPGISQEAMRSLLGRIDEISAEALSQ